MVIDIVKEKYSGKRGKRVPAKCKSCGSVMNVKTMKVKLLKDLVSWYDKNKDKYPSNVLAAVVHNQFEYIHPFTDGNGSVGRLLLNNILLKHGKPPMNIELKNRLDYYAALIEYENNGNIRPTIELILKDYRNPKKLLSS